MDKSTAFIKNDKTLKNYFTFSEFIKTSTGILNFPQTSLQLANLSRTWYILNGLRERFGAPIYINSGYRCPAVNRAVAVSKIPIIYKVVLLIFVHFLI